MNRGRNSLATGATKHPLYKTWKTMRSRCNTPTCHKYPRYGGRGISICPRWDDFFLFVEDMGDRPEGATLDRIDNDGNYEPNNCRWASSKTQSRNTSTNHFVEFGGEKLTISTLSERFGIAAHTIRKRIVELGWDVAEAISIQPRSPEAYAHQRRHMKPSCARGHAFVLGSFRLNPKGDRVCIACERIRGKIARDRKRGQ